jgi:hypothetical protein
MNSRVRLGLEAWAAHVDAAEEKKGKKSSKKGKRRFGLHYVNSPSAGLRYKILTCVASLVGGIPI